MKVVFQLIKCHGLVCSVISGRRLSVNKMLYKLFKVYFHTEWKKENNFSKIIETLLFRHIHIFCFS